MSGVYLVVWSPEDKEKSPVLCSTTGGYPHITVAYTGEFLSYKELVAAARKIFKASLCLVTVTEAYVNSLSPGDNERHDVLMRVDMATVKRVELARILLEAMYPLNANEFFMGEPHITHSIHETKEEAEAECAKMNAIFKVGPYPCTITGVTID